VRDSQPQKIFLPSPFATAEAQQHLLDVTGCNAYVHPTSMTEKIQNFIQVRPSLRSIDVPDVTVWFTAQVAQHYPYQKSWEQARLDPWIIFHTSGTTGKKCHATFDFASWNLLTRTKGLPTPVTCTNGILTSWDVAETMPHEQETNSEHFRNDRWYTPLPTLHVSFS